MCERDYKTGRCVDCGEPCSRRAERCRSCREKFRWRNPGDPRRVPPYPLSPDDPLWPKCACGCGEPVPARKGGSTARGFVRGEPCRFVAGHSSRVQRVDISDGMKDCPKCGERKPLSAFNACPSRSSGLDSWCRACMKAEGKRRRGPSKYRKWVDPDERNRAYAAARRALKRNQFVEHVEPSVVFERDGGVCGICHEPVSPDDFHVDHVVPLVRGGEHSYANVQVAHPSCNCRKKDRVDFRIDTGESASAAA